MVQSEVKVSPLHFLEKFEECLLQDLMNSDFPILSGAIVRRFLNFPKNKASICVFDKEESEMLAKVEIYEISGPNKKSVLKGCMLNILDEKQENLFFLMDGTGNLAIEAYKSYQNFKSLFNIKTDNSSSAEEDDESDEPTDEEIAAILDLSSSGQSEDLNSGDFLQSVLSEAEEAGDIDLDPVPEEKPAGEYSVRLSPEDLLKTIEND